MRIRTPTQQYTDEVKLDELAEALARAADNRNAQASPDLATLEGEASDELETLRWRRRESNPRPGSVAIPIPARSERSASHETERQPPDSCPGWSIPKTPKRSGRRRIPFGLGQIEPHSSTRHRQALGRREKYSHNGGMTPRPPLRRRWPRGGAGERGPRSPSWSPSWSPRGCRFAGEMLPGPRVHALWGQQWARLPP